mgnify:CR=1 FL=1
MALFKDQDGVMASAGIVTQVDVSNVHDTTPTLAQIQAAFPNKKAGFVGVINDANGGTNLYVCTCYNDDNTIWGWTKQTKAL